MTNLAVFALQALAAVALVVAGGVASYTVSAAVVPCRPTLLRWLTTVIAGIWMATAAFHLLAFVQKFTLPVAMVGAGLLMLATFHPALLANTRASLARDRRILRWLSRRRVSRWRLCTIAGFTIFGALLTGRTLVAPPLAWDTLTYHGVKSALWVQNAGSLPLRAPGGWSAYRDYFGGAEVLMAWAMLPFGYDALALVVDAVVWLALGLAIISLARELNVREPFASAAAGFVLMIPTVQLLVGSGYVELALNLAFVAGIAFAIRFMRAPRPVWVAFAFAALGIAAGVKVTAFPLVAIVSVLLMVRVVVVREARTAHATALAVGALAAAVLVAPWMWNNVRESGYPLSPMPISIHGVTLGRANDVIAWYEDRPDLKSSPETERAVVGKVFRFPPARNENLGGLAAIPLVLFPLGVASIARRSKFAAVMLSAAALAIVALFYAPSFRTVRLGWSVSSSRFLLPLLCLALPVSVAWWRHAPRTAQWYLGFLSISIVLNAVFMATTGWGAADARATIAVLTVCLFITAIVVTSSFRRAAMPGRVIVAAVMVVAGLYVLTTWRETNRYQMLRASTVLDGVPKYWVDAAAAADAPPTRRKIAVTAGPLQTADNWFLYHFLGRKLQNELTYVPLVDVDAWQHTLSQQRVTHVMSFVPTSTELQWMEDRPQQFERLAGEKGHWGLFAISATREAKR